MKADTSSGGATVAEELLRASAAAQRESGAPITTHTTAGTPGYRYIIDRFLRHLRPAGLEQDAVRALVVDNSARFLRWG
ncbi:MAG TPA: hypothetical protein VE440_02605 [Gaiellaceae bacterium]|nr:hypothetical protein [Gaiellaceae bacterium]